MNRFCPKCGTEQGPFVDGFCMKCFLEDNRLLIVPGRLELRRCKRCGRVLINRKWVSDSADNITSYILGKIKWADMEEKALDIELKRLQNGIRVFLNVSGRFKGVSLSARYETFICYKNQLCNACLKLSSGYHEAVVQIRHSGSLQSTVLSSVKKILESMQSKDPLARIVKTFERKNGLDMLIGSNKSAKLLVKELKKRFNASVKRTSSLIGVTKDGKRKVKYTYLVRLS
ncbi:MAG: 60S ribosomal export protein NMD3 [Candidatus Diapherotrites archaeon]|nr:60S ribosomal export protein NMD3 [Candidatus Diapherotrites archaeon]